MERYSEEAARQILKQAVDLQVNETEFSHDQLMAMADELGLSKESVLAAEQKWLAGREGIEERQAFERHRRQAFRTHLAVYVMVNLFLFLINLMTGTSTWWFVFPLLGWGLGLAIHGWTAQQNDGDAYENEFLQWQLQRKIKDKVYRKLSS